MTLPSVEGEEAELRAEVSKMLDVAYEKALGHAMDREIGTTPLPFTGLRNEPGIQIRRITDDAALVTGVSLPVPEFVRTAVEQGRAFVMQDEIVFQSPTPDEIKQLTTPLPVAEPRTLREILFNHRALAAATAREITELMAELQPLFVNPETTTLTLVPVETFGGDECEHPGCDDPKCPGGGIGMSDAVGPAWSDCNRAWGKIYRVEDLGTPEEFHQFEGEQVRVDVTVKNADLPFFAKRFGDSLPEDITPKRRQCERDHVGYPSPEPTCRSCGRRRSEIHADNCRLLGGSPR